MAGLIQRLRSLEGKAEDEIGQSEVPLRRLACAWP